MIKSNQVKSLILITILSLIVFLSYHLFLKDIYWNNQTQEIHISQIPMNKPIILQKHKQQNFIYSIEFEITGNTNQNIYLMYDPEEDQMIRQIKIKKGKIEFVTTSDWYTEKCFLFISGEAVEETDLLVKYRFIGGKY